MRGGLRDREVWHQLAEWPRPCSCCPGYAVPECVGLGDRQGPPQLSAWIRSHWERGQPQDAHVDNWGHKGNCPLGGIDLETYSSHGSPVQWREWHSWKKHRLPRTLYLIHNKDPIWRWLVQINRMMCLHLHVISWTTIQSTTFMICSVENRFFFQQWHIRWLSHLTMSLCSFHCLSTCSLPVRNIMMTVHNFRNAVMGVK